jgi:hypothetical protein
VVTEWRQTQRHERTRHVALRAAADSGVTPRSSRAFHRDVTTMHRPVVSCAAALAAVLAFAAPSPLIAQSSQFSAVKSAMERVRSLRSDVSDSKDRAALIPVGRALADAAEAVRSNGGELGRSLAEAPGNYSSERARIRERAAHLVRGAEILKKQAVNWVATLEGTNDPKDMTRESNGECERMIQSWEAFVRETEDRRRWLASGLAQAKELRENVAKPGAQLQRAEQDAAQVVKESDERLKRSFMEWFGVKGELADAQVRMRQAHEAWTSTLGREGPSEFSQRMRAAVDAWYAANDKVVELARRDWDLFVKHEGMVAESRRITERYSTQVMELRRFLKDMQGTDANRNWQEFKNWSELFEREFGR